MIKPNMASSHVAFSKKAKMTITTKTIKIPRASPPKMTNRSANKIRLKRSLAKIKIRRLGLQFNTLLDNAFPASLI